MLTPKQMLQRLPIALAQVKAGKTSENLLNEIRQIISSIYRAKEIIKKVCNSIMNSINTNMDTIFMKSENSKTSDPQRQSILKIDLRKIDKYIALSNLRIYYTWKNIKKSSKNNKFKISAPAWNEEFELLDGSYSVSNIQDNFKYVFKNETATDNPSIRIYITKLDKWNGVVILYLKLYKLEKLNKDPTVKREASLQRFLRKLKQ